MRPSHKEKWLWKLIRCCFCQFNKRCLCVTYVSSCLISDQGCCKLYLTTRSLYLKYSIITEPNILICKLISSTVLLYFRYLMELMVIGISWEVIAQDTITLEGFPANSSQNHRKSSFNIKQTHQILKVIERRESSILPIKFRRPMVSVWGINVTWVVSFNHCTFCT